MKENDNKLRPLEKSDGVMTVLWIFFILAGFALCVTLLVKVICHKDDRFTPYLVPKDQINKISPVRGNILDYKNRVLAMSTLSYEVHIDCNVPKDTLWNNNVHSLAESLTIFPGEKRADEYLKLLEDGRSSQNGYLLLARNVAQENISKLRAMPILKYGRYHGGYLENRSQKRLYPYGRAARRTIGDCKLDSTKTEKAIGGVEKAFDSRLHGVDGVQVLRPSDFGRIPVLSSKNKDSQNGLDVRTTLDIDIQTIAENALRKTIEKSDLIESACIIILETRTGAVRAMVNLNRNSKGEIGEWDSWNNYSIRMAEAPGSVFKSAVVMAMLEDRHVESLDHNIATYGGIWTYNRQTYNDTKHVGKKRFPSGRIKLREAFEMSANNPFRQLVCDNYGDDPARFINKIKSFGLMDTLSFDINKVTPPFILEPDMKKRTYKGSWDGGTFPRIAIGYCMELSPLNIVTFYNAIANDGKMLKPYLVDAILENGKVVESFGPTVLHESICRKSTADTLKKVMGMVTSDKGGTAYWQLHGAVCPIAGKTGTAQRAFRNSAGRMVMSDNGIESQQGSFVGFFPTDRPKYTGIVVVWSKPSERNFFGATYAAPPFREIADKIYCLNEDR